MSTTASTAANARTKPLPARRAGFCRDGNAVAAKVLGFQLARYTAPDGRQNVVVQVCVAEQWMDLIFSAELAASLGAGLCAGAGLIANLGAQATTPTNGTSADPARASVKQPPCVPDAQGATNPAPGSQTGRNACPTFGAGSPLQAPSRKAALERAVPTAPIETSTGACISFPRVAAQAGSPIALPRTTPGNPTSREATAPCVHGKYEIENHNGTADARRLKAWSCVRATEHPLFPRDPATARIPATTTPRRSGQGAGEFTHTTPIGLIGRIGLI